MCGSRDEFDEDHAPASQADIRESVKVYKHLCKRNLCPFYYSRVANRDIKTLRAQVWFCRLEFTKRCVFLHVCNLWKIINQKNAFA